jgi:hypothetical protein
MYNNHLDTDRRGGGGDTGELFDDLDYSCFCEDIHRSICHF